jgi:hypothetical protein
LSWIRSPCAGFDRLADRERGDPACRLVVDWRILRGGDPAARNELGLDIAAAASAVDEIERTFELLLSDEAMVYRLWKRLIVGERMTGRRVFGGRLVAVMLAHGVERLPTFNGADFSGLGIVVLEPQAVLSL